MKIGIDIDGVLTNVEEYILNHGSKFFYEKNKNLNIDINGYEIDGTFNVSKNEKKEFWDYHSDEYFKSSPREYASEVINKLIKEGNTIIIITARGADGNKIDQIKKEYITKRWLKKNKIKYNDIIFTPEDKLKTCKDFDIDIIIEDKPENIINLSKHLKVYCYDARYNENIKGDNIIHCYSWYDIYYKLTKKN